MITPVANYRDPETPPIGDGVIYIGRDMPKAGLVGAGWGNPYTLKKDTEENRVVAVMLYREYAIRNTEIRKQVATLRGKTLVCWCAPERCHGDALAELADLCTHHGGLCPHCRKGKMRSLPCLAADPATQFESWACPTCKAYGFGPMVESNVFAAYACTRPTI